MYRIAPLGLLIAACSGGTPKAVEVRQSPPSINRRPVPSSKPAPPAARAPADSPNEWEAKLRKIARTSTGSATLELATDIPTSTFLEIVEAARWDFDSIDVARGTSVIRLSGPPPSTDSEKLVVSLGRTTFFVQVSKKPASESVTVQSGVVEDVGRQIQRFLTSTWPNAPCELTVLTYDDVPLFTIVDALVGVSMARPCVSSFSFSVTGYPREPRHALRSGGRALTLRVPLPPAPGPPRSTLQEERDVRVDNVVEHWRLQWRDDPTPVCFGEWRCPCSQFQYGQRGEAELIRSRPGSPDEVFPLASLFDGHLDLPLHGLNESILLTWPKAEKDLQTEDKAALATEVRARPRVTAMDLHDYDRDGRATEFVLPVGGIGCAYFGYVVVGISRARPKLHVFGTAANQSKPLEMGRAGWDVLRKSSAGTYIAVECGFRGADEQVEIALRAVAGRIHAISTRYTCPRTNGRVIERQVW